MFALPAHYSITLKVPMLLIAAIPGTLSLESSDGFIMLESNLSDLIIAILRLWTRKY